MSAATIVAGNYIPIVQERICLICNNYFDSDTIYLETTATFNTTAQSITINQTSWEQYGFKVNDDIIIYKSLRNDGIVTLSSITGNVAVIASTSSIVNESYSTNPSTCIYFGLVQWPKSVIQAAALMIYFDTDLRDKYDPQIKSRSLGPLSESYGGIDESNYGYPSKIIDRLLPFMIARFN
jgi:hypothetical protein